MSSVKQDDPMGMQARRQRQPTMDAASRQNLEAMQEMKEIKDVIWHGILYRGVPLGFLGYLSAKSVVGLGYFQKYSRPLSTFMIGLGFITGVNSFTSEKMLDLKNARLADKKQKIIDMPEDEPIESPLSSKDGHMARKWDEIRKETRQAQVTSETEKGISYHDLRLKNRARQGNYSHLTPEEENNMRRNNSRRTLGTEESKANVEDSNKNEERHTEENLKKSVGGSIPRRNKYGDQVL